MKKFLWRWLPVILWMIVIYIGSSIGGVPRVGGKAIDGMVHRAAHLIEFAVLGALVLRAVSNGTRAITRREMIVTLIIVALYGASDEFHQRFTPGRSSEGIAVVFDALGGLIGMLVWRWYRRISRPVRGGAPAVRQQTHANQSLLGESSDDPIH
jgi:hypothetical protein